MYSNFVVETKKSKTEEIIPVVNEVHLHSAYNPENEARNFIIQKEQDLAENSNVLVFGLGFGYHISALLDEMKSRHDNFKIVVIEPMAQMIEAFHKEGFSLDTKHIKLFHFETIDEYYRCEELVQFMVNKPLVLPHPPSFKLCGDFFKMFMSHKSSKMIQDITPLIESRTISKYLESNQGSFPQLLKNLSQTSNVSRSEDFLFMAYKELVTTNGTGVINE